MSHTTNKQKQKQKSLNRTWQISLFHTQQTNKKNKTKEHQQNKNMLNQLMSHTQQADKENKNKRAST